MMEDKLKKQKIKYFFYSLFAYLLGATIYDLIFNYERNGSRVIFAFIFGFVIRALYDLYEHKRYPEMKEKEKQLEKDERLIIIKDKAAYVTYNITIFILAISWIVTIVKQNEELNIFITVLILVMIATMELSKYYLSKKM